MDPLHVAVALGPLGLYLLVVGTLNLGRRPRVLTGVVDVWLLALGLAGLVIAGPLELFLPEAAAARFGPTVWAIVIGLYFTAVAFTSLVLRPRLVVYNAPTGQLRRLLGELTLQLDGEARWAGDSVMMPQLGVHFYLESYALMRNTGIVAIGRDQNLDGWNALSQALAAALDDFPAPVNPRGYMFVSGGLLVLSFAVLRVVLGAGEIATNWAEMLRK